MAGVSEGSRDQGDGKKDGGRSFTTFAPIRGKLFEISPPLIAGTLTTPQ